MDKIVHEFLDELELAGVYVLGLSIFKLLDLFYEWLGRQNWSTNERIAWLNEEYT